MRRGTRIVAAAVVLALATPVAAHAAPTAAPARMPLPGASITASPATDLVDGQIVAVVGAGFTPDVELMVYQCRADLAECRRAVADRTHTVPAADGSFTADASLQAAFTGWNGTDVDCRSEACALAVDYRFRIDAAPGPARPGGAPDQGVPTEGDEFPLTSLPVAFDPAAPLLPSPTLVAAPDAGLVDGQQVHVSGAGYRPGARVFLTLCLADPTSFGACDFSGAFPRRARAGADGTLGVDLQVSALMAGFDVAPKDCRAVECSLVAYDHDFLDDEYAEAPLTFDPDAPLLPPAVATVTPSSGLVDGQTVTVTGHGFRAQEYVWILQCRGDAAHVPRISDCSLVPYPPYDTSATDAGDLHTSLRVRTVLETVEDDVDCRVVSCVLVLERAGSFRPVVLALSFGADAAPVARPVASTPTFTG